jgi:hypothetical protein
MATLEQLESALINADKAGDIDAARQLAAFISRARKDAANLIPGSQIPETIVQQPTQGIGEQIVGAGETALTLATGATGGTLGLAGGAVKGLAEQILSGQFGTQEANEAVKQAAIQGSQALTYAPRTQAGQEQVQAVGQTLANIIPPVIPMIAAPGMATQAVRQAMPIVSATAARGGAAIRQGAQQVQQRAVQAAQQAKQAVGFGDEAAAIARRPAGAAATPAEMQRVATAEGLPVPVKLTKGAASREAEQLAFEKEQIKGPLGGALRSRAEENNLQALQNFDALIDMAEARAPDISATGNAVTKALAEGYKAAKNKVNVAYKKAELAGELEQPVALESIAQFIKQTEPESSVAPILKVAKDKAIQLGVLQEMPDGSLVSQPVPLKTAELYRRSISNATDFQPTNQRFGAQIKDLIDQSTDGLGGNLYKEARALRTQQARKYENRAIIARLVSTRRGMDDPQVAADQVFRKSILNASPEEITFMKRVLQTSGKNGQQAWKELQGATINYLRDEATKGVGMDSQGRPLVSPAKLNQVVNQLDANGRLDVIFGKQRAQTIRDLNEVVRFVNTVPPGTLINSSGTSMALMGAIAEAGAAGAMTGLPVPAISLIRAATQQMKNSQLKARINKSLSAGQ